MTIGTLVTAFVFVTSPPTQPKFAGRSLTVWLQDARLFGGTDPRKAAEAERAIREIGTNAIPFIMRWAFKEESFAEKINRALPKRLKRWRGIMTQDESYDLAREGFRILGDSAAGAVPTLIAVLGADDYIKSIIATEMLASIGPAAHGAVPALIQKANSGNSTLRMVALLALGSIRSHSDLVVPYLAQQLGDATPKDQRIAALISLAEFGPLAKSAEANIAALLQVDDPATRTYASNAITKLTR
jgi:hypothetical protein